MNAVVRTLMRGYGLAVMGFPFGIDPPRSEVERIRRDAAAERYGTKPLWVRVLLWLLRTLLWPLGAAVETAMNVRSIPQVTWRDRLLIYRWAILYNVPPVEYVAYGFLVPAARSLWAEYLYWFDVPVLRRLNCLRGAANEDVQNKHRFADICAAYKLPQVRTLASVRISIGQLPEGDIWLKTHDGNGGAGSELWQRGVEGYTGAAGTVTAKQLLERAQNRKLLIQPRVRNHPSLESLTNGALASLRIVTGHHRDGHVSLLGNMLVLPQGSSMTSAGGATCAVEWDTGRIRQVLYAQDPDLITRATGWLVPFWQESIEMVSRAHRDAFPLFATLGWDVALTHDGPLLLETNSGWGALALQQLWGPLGKTPFAELVKEALAAAR